MKTLMYKIAHGLLVALDMLAFVLHWPWEYSDSQKRRMKEKINGKK